MLGRPSPVPEQERFLNPLISEMRTAEAHLQVLGHSDALGPSCLGLLRGHVPRQHKPVDVLKVEDNGRQSGLQTTISELPDVRLPHRLEPPQDLSASVVDGMRAQQ